MNSSTMPDPNETADEPHAIRAWTEGRYVFLELTDGLAMCRC